MLTPHPSSPPSRRLCGHICGVLAIVAAASLVAASGAAAATFTVNTQTDAALATSTDTSCPAQCTLREAIQAADNLGGASTITLASGTYKLTIAPVSGMGANDDPAHGDLDVDQEHAAPSVPQITITGAAAGSTIIDANAIDRAFAIHFFSSLSLSGVTIKGGAQPGSGPSNSSNEPGDGGAIDTQGSLTITNSVLSNSSAGQQGGAIYDSGSGDVAVLDSTIAGNVAPIAGGAMAFVGGGVITLIDDTFDSDKATGGTGVGGALAYLNPAGANSEIENVTIAHNTAPIGGGLFNASDAGRIENTIVADNSDAGVVGGAAGCGIVGMNGLDQAGAADIGGNLDGDGTCFSPAITTDRTTVATPFIGELGDNGGPTPTDALDVGSPAIGLAIASACTAFDQRGATRLPAFCDAGSFQTVDADLALTATGPATARQGHAITDTFTVTNNGPNAADVTFTDPLPAGTTFGTPTASQGSCTGGATVTCALGTLAAGSTATIAVALTPASVGTVTNAASVSAAPFDANATNNAASVATSVTSSAPANTGLPTISGQVAQGATLTASPGVWTNDPTAFLYRWQNCDSHGARCQTNNDADLAATVQHLDTPTGDTVRVVVTAVNAFGSANATSSATVPVVGLIVQVGAPTTTATAVNLPIECAGLNILYCLLVVSLTADVPATGNARAVAGAATAHHTKKVTVGTLKIKLRGGTHKTVAVKLNQAGRHLLAKHHKLKVTLKITQNGHLVKTRTVTFKSKPARKHRH